MIKKIYFGTALILDIFMFMFLMLGWSFDGFTKDNIYIIVLILGILCGIATVYLVKKGKTTDNISSKPNKNIYEFSFKGEYLWDAVAT